MTILDLCTVANVSRRSIRRTVEKLFPGKMANGHRTTFSKEEAEKILGAVRKVGNLIPGPGQIAQGAQVHKLPSGAQITAMLKVYGPKDMAKRLDFVLGYKEPVLTVAAKPVQKSLGFDGPAATEEEIRQAFTVPVAARS